MNVTPFLCRVGRPVWYYTTNILLLLACLLPFTLYNKKWFEGYRHYRTQYKIAFVHGETPSLREVLEKCYHTFQEQAMWPRTHFDNQWYFFQRCEGARDGLFRRVSEGRDMSQTSLGTTIWGTVLAGTYFFGTFILRIWQAIRYFSVYIIFHTLVINLAAVWGFISSFPKFVSDLWTSIQDSRISIAHTSEHNWKAVQNYTLDWSKTEEIGNTSVDFVKNATQKDILGFSKLIDASILAAPEIVKNFTKLIIATFYMATMICNPDSVWLATLVYALFVVAFLSVFLAGLTILNIIRNHLAPLSRPVRYLAYIFVAVCLVISSFGVLLLIDFLWSLDWFDTYTHFVSEIHQVIIPHIVASGQYVWGVIESVGAWVAIVWTTSITAIAAMIAILLIWRDKVSDLTKDLLLKSVGYLVFATFLIGLGLIFIAKLGLEFLVQHTLIAKSGLMLASQSIAGLVLLYALVLCILILYMIIFYPLIIEICLMEIDSRLGLPETKIGLTKLYTLMGFGILLCLSLLSQIIPKVFVMPSLPTDLPQSVQWLVDGSFMFWYFVKRATDTFTGSITQAGTYVLVWLQGIGSSAWEIISTYVGYIISIIVSVRRSFLSFIPATAIISWETTFLLAILAFILQPIGSLGQILINTVQYSVIGISIWLWLLAIFLIAITCYKRISIWNPERAALIDAKLFAACEKILWGYTETKTFISTWLSRAWDRVYALAISVWGVISILLNFIWQNLLVRSCRFVCSVLRLIVLYIVVFILAIFRNIINLTLWTTDELECLYRWATPWWNALTAQVDTALDFGTAGFLTAKYYIHRKFLQVWEWVKTHKRPIAKALMTVLASLLICFLCWVYFDYKPADLGQLQGRGGNSTISVVPGSTNIQSSIASVDSGSASAQGSSANTTSDQVTSTNSEGVNEVNPCTISHPFNKWFSNLSSATHSFTLHTIYLPISKPLWNLTMLTLKYLTISYSKIFAIAQVIYAFLKDTAIVIKLWSIVAYFICFLIARRLRIGPWAAVFTVVGLVIVIVPLVVLYDGFLYPLLRGVGVG